MPDTYPRKTRPLVTGIPSIRQYRAGNKIVQLLIVV